MTSDIAEILKKGESETAEFKGPRTPSESLARAVCGLLNQQGGVLLWGVDDQGRPVGVEDAERRGKELNGFLMRHLHPRPLLSVSVHEAADQQVVAIDIPPGADKPYSVNREIWVRIGNRTLRADEEVSAGLVERSAMQLERWERAPMPGFGLEDCDADELMLARTEITRAGRFGLDVPANDEELLRRLYLAKDGQLTNAAMVLFARRPRAWAPNLAVRVVSYGQDKSGPLASDVIVEGAAIRVLKEVVGIVQQRTGFSARFETGRLERQDRPAYAVFALREGLVNAIVHRDYGAVGGDVRVEIFPDYLVIENPGKLPEGWTPKDLQEKHGSHPGNPDIARVFYLRELMEQLGIGTQKLIAACKELNARAPVWRAEQGVVSLTLFRAPEPEARTQLAGRQMEFLESIKLGAEFKVGDYASAVNASERQARRELAQLVSLGLVERLGKGPATYYRRTTRSLS
jgi:ATP-dependent DNA helicase RecG